MSISNTQSVPPLPNLPPGNYKLFSKSVNLFCFVNNRTHLIEHQILRAVSKKKKYKREKCLSEEAF